MPVSTTSDPVDRHPSVSSTEWEEPHPGRRLSCPAEPSLGDKQDYDQDAQRLDGFGDGTVGTLNTTSRGLHSTTTNGSSQFEVPAVIRRQAASAGTSAIVSPDSDSAISGSLSESPSSVLTCQTLDVDMGVDLSSTDKMMVDRDDNSPQSPSFLALSPISEYEDLSRYLDGSPGSANYPGSESLYSMVDVSNPAAYSHAAPLEDMYGWNAAWDNRLTSPRATTTPPTVDTTYSGGQSSTLSRRVHTNKHGLLQRVLSVGKAPSRISTSRRARFSP